MFEEDQLEKQVDELVRHNESVRRENELYQSYLDRNIQAVSAAEEEDRRERQQKSRGRKRQQVCRHSFPYTDYCIFRFLKYLMKTART